MIDIPGSGDDEISRFKNFFVIFFRNAVVKTSHGFWRSSNRQSQRVIGEKSLAEYLTQILLRRIIDHLHFLDNYALLSFQIGLVKSGIYEHIRNEIKGLR